MAGNAAGTRQQRSARVRAPCAAREAGAAARYDRARYQAASRQPTRRPKHAAVLILAIAIGFALAALGAGPARPAIERAIAAIGSAAGIEGAASSTPRTLWRHGSVPHLYQTDDAWAEAPYGAGTIATHGCGPTCLSMAYVALTGRTDMDPLSMARYSEGNGFLDEGITSWALMGEGASALGLASRELPADAATVEAALEGGAVVVCSVGPGDFTTSGHFIVLAGLAEDGVAIRDPNSPGRSSRVWALDQVLPQCRNLWALSAT